MKDIIDWLRKIEHIANEVYSKAAQEYADDKKLRSFLDHIAEDEAWHYHVMGSAAEFISSQPEIIPAISVDEQTSSKIINTFEHIKSGLENKTISREELIDKIVEVELSEWNDIFLYTVNLLKEQSHEFIYPAARMQAHINGIEYFLERIEGRPKALQKITDLPPIWVENILIVDDEEMIAELFRALLNRSGNIDIANNGQEALGKMEGKYYKLIISDIDMPVMDGISFYREAIAKYPEAKKKFIFVTGSISSDKQSFFMENGLKYLTKPMDIKVLRDEAEKTLIS